MSNYVSTNGEEWQGIGYGKAQWFALPYATPTGATDESDVVANQLANASNVPDQSYKPAQAQSIILMVGSSAAGRQALTDRAIALGGNATRIQAALVAANQASPPVNDLPASVPMSTGMKVAIGAAVLLGAYWLFGRKR